MADQPLALRVRRGLVALVDGVILTVDGLAVLAVVVGLVGLATGGTGSPLYALTIGAVYGWATTPGVVVLELLVYAALAVVALGPVWHWYVGFPTAGSGSRADATEEFEFTPGSPTGDGHRSQLANGGNGDATVGGAVLPGRETGESPWATELFDRPSAPKTVPPGDFLRSAGGGGSQAEGERGAESHADGEPAADPNHGGSDANAAPVDGEAPQRTVADEEQSHVDATVRVSMDGAAREAGATGEAAPDTETTAEAGADGDAPGADTEPPASDAEPDDADPPEAAGDHPADRVADAVADARATVGAVEEGLARATAAAPADAAAAQLAESAETADAAVRELRAALPDGDGAAAEAVAAARERSRQIESAVESVAGD